MPVMLVKSSNTAYKLVREGEWWHIHQGRQIRINLTRMRDKLENPGLPDQICEVCINK